MTKRRTAACAWLASLLMLAGACACARPAWHWLVGAVSSATGRQAWAEARRRPEEDLAPGTPACWLRIPDCGLDTLVLQGDSERNLRRAPCLTRIPGKRVVTAHRDRHFRSLAAIRAGSRIELTDRSGAVTRFRVTDTEVLEKGDAEARLLEQRGGPWLVLMTCYPFRYVGPAPQRFLAWAVEEEDSVEGEAAARRSAANQGCGGQLASSRYAR